MRKTAKKKNKVRLNGSARGFWVKWPDHLFQVQCKGTSS